jgi:VWFA-related protein
MSNPRVLALVLIAAAAAGHTVWSQQPDSLPQFRTGVDLVRLDVSVLDRNRQPIHGLRAEDFTVLENGKPQPVVAFAAVEIPSAPPAAAGWMHEVASDVANNQLDLRRVVVIIMDDGMTAPDDGVPRAAKQIARGVIDRLGPNDLAAVVFTFQGKSQNFTSDRRQLIAAADSFSPKATQAPAQFSAAMPNSRVNPALSGPPLGCAMAGGGDSCLTRTLKSVASALEDTPVGRKTVVLISSGTPYTFRLENLETGSDINDLQKTFRQLQNANVNVYPFDPRGLTQEGINSTKIESLQMFAENTGGRATIATNTPWEQVPQVFAENSSYYLLGIRPGAGQPGSFRRLSIKVAKPDAEVRTRAGYYAVTGARARGNKAATPVSGLDTAFGSALPSGTLPLDVSAAPFASLDGKQGIVVVTTGVRRTVSATAAPEKFQVRTAAFDAGTLKERAGQQHTAEVTPRPNAPGERRFEVQSRLGLRPGRYEIRSAAEAPGASGGVFLQVEVPDFSKARLSLSGLVLGLTKTGQQDGVADLLPIAPTTARSFPRSGQAAAFVRIYQGGKDPLVPVQMHLRILDAAQRAVIDQTMTFDPGRFAPGRAADCPFQLPLDRLADGEHLLTVEASAGKETARRDVRFTVRD